MNQRQEKDAFMFHEKHPYGPSSQHVFPFSNGWFRRLSFAIAFKCFITLVLQQSIENSCNKVLFVLVHFPLLLSFSGTFEVIIGKNDFKPHPPNEIMLPRRGPSLNFRQLPLVLYGRIVS